MFPVLAKAGAWGRLAPPKECQVKLARLTDLHFLGCLPKPLSPQPSLSYPLGLCPYSFYHYTGHPLGWSKGHGHLETWNSGIP